MKTGVGLLTRVDSLNSQFLQIVPKYVEGSLSLWEMKPIVRIKPIVSPYPNIPLNINDELIRKLIPDVVRRDIERLDYKEYKEQKKLVSLLYIAKFHELKFIGNLESRTRISTAFVSR